MTELVGGSLFQHGVASGDPTPRRVVIWTRVTAPAGRTPAATAPARSSSAAEAALRQALQSARMEFRSFRVWMGIQWARVRRHPTSVKPRPEPRLQQWLAFALRSGHIC